MADIQSNLRINVDTSGALSQIKNLQRQISAFHESIRNSGNAANQAISDNLSRNLLNSINSTQKFAASMTTVNDATQSFTNALERNKFSMGQYFKYAAGSTKTFGGLFKKEFDTIETVARDRVKTLQTQYIRMGRDATGALEAIKVKPLRLDMQNLGTQVAMTAQKQQLFNQLIKQGSTNLLNFGKNTQWAGRQLMVGFTIPLSIMGTMAIKEFEKIEKQAIRFKRVYGDAMSTDAETDAALANMRTLATEFAKYGIQIEKTLELAADVAQMGLKGAELRAQVAEATRLAVLGEVEQQQALEATISVTNAFGVAAEDLASKINFLNSVENETLTSIEDLTIAIPKAGPVIKQLGGSVEDLAFFLTAMREGGINASEGANALKSALSKIINPTEKASEMLAGYGINIKAIVEGNAGDIKSTILSLGQAFDQLAPLDRSKAIEQLFGTFQFARISALFANISKEGGQAAKVLEISQKSAAELKVLADRELKKVEESPIFKLEKAIGRLQESLAPLGEEFIKIITPLVEFGTKILKSFNQMDDGAKAFVTNLITIFGLIAPAAIMTFGLIANGIANFIKGANFVRIMFGKLAGAGTGLNQMTQYMNQEQLEATAIAASLGHAHSQLTATFTSEKIAVDGLVRSYRDAISAMNAYTVASQTRMRPGGAPASQTKKYASGVLSVPGPKGAGDVVPAMLSPGEAVIPAEEAEKYRGFISQMISGNIPGFSKGVMLGMPQSAKNVSKNRTAAEAIYQKFLTSRYAQMPVTDYGHQLSPTSGHSFPIFGLGGVYMNAAGKKVFVKPMVDETAALAEMRGTQIARQAHGLKAPQQRIVVIRDPQDVRRKRKFLALESDLDPTFLNTDEKAVFNQEQYFRQLVASLVRADKDLAAGNLFGDVVADVGPAGVFARASGERSYTTNLPSMEEQATINLLGVRGGAKRAFAESTVGLMADMSAEQYHQKMLSEINRVLPMLRQTVAGFQLTDQTEVDAYNAMIKRLEDGRNVDWKKFHAMHSAVKVKSKPSQSALPKYADGVLTVPGPKGAGDIVPAMLSPGEAVIPADKAKKYRGFISQMISGNVPGFNGGTIGAGLSFPKIDQQSLAIVLREAETYAALGKQEAAVAEQAIRSLSNQKQQSMKDWRRILALTGVEAGQGSQNQILNKALMETYPDSKARKSQFKGFRGSQAGTAQSLIPKYGMESEAEVASTVSKGAYESLVGQGVSSEDAFTMTQYDPNKPGSGVALGHKVDVGSGKLLPEGWQKEFVSADPYLENSVLSSMTSTDKTSTTQVFEAYQSAAKALQEKKTLAEAEWSSLESAIRGDQSFTEAQRKTFANVNKEVAQTGAADSAITMRAKALAQGYSDADIQNISGYRVQSSEAEINSAGQKLVEAKKTKLGGEGVITPEQKAKIEQDGRNLIDGLLNAIDEAAQMRSPSREMYERGKNIVRGIFNGVADAYRESTGQTLPSSGTSVPPPPIPGFESQVSEPYVDPDQARGSAIGKKFVNKAENFLENQIMGEGFFSKTQMGQNLKSAFLVNDGDLNSQLEFIEGETQLERSKRELLVQQRNVQAVNAGQYAEVGRLLDEERLNLDEEQINIAQQKQNLDQEEAVTKTRRQLRAEERSADAEAAKTLKQKKAQDRQVRAGKALSVLGTATMIAGMASGIDGVVGEIAQKAMPFLAGLSAVAPILLALPAPLAVLAGVVGLVAFGFYKYNEELKKVREENRKLGESMAAGTKNMERLAEAAGTATPTQIMDVRRSGISEQVARVAGKTSFGVSFFDSESGDQMVEEFNQVAKTFGRSAAVDSIKNQLATAMASGILDSKQAGSIALELGNQINDFGVSIEIAAELSELFGPNGEKLLSGDPLQIAIDLSERSVTNFVGNIQDAANALSGEGGWLATFLGMDTEAIAAYAGGALQGFMEEQQNALDTLDAGTEKRIENLQKEAAALQAQGKDASSIFAKIEKEREDLYTNRQKLLDEFQANFDQALLATETTKVTKKDLDEFRKKAEETVDAEIALRDPSAEPLKQGERAEMIQKELDRLIQEFNPEYHLQEKVYEGFIAGIKQGLEELPEESRKQAEGAIDTISKMEINIGAKIMLNSAIASGDLSIDSIGKLFEGFDFAGEGSTEFYFEMIGDIVLKGGGKTAIKQLDAVFSAINNVYESDADAANVSITVVESLSALEGIDLTKALDQLSFFSTFISLFDGVDPITAFLKMSKQEKDDMFERIDLMQKLVDSTPDKPLKVEQVLEQKIITDTAMAAAFKADAEFFEKLDPVQQFLYIQRFIAISSTMTDEEAVARLSTRGVLGESIEYDTTTSGIKRTYSREQIAGEYANLTKETLGIENLLSNLGGNEEGPKGGGTKEDPFENILNRLKQLRNYTINAAGGAKELLRVLGEGKKITVFRGMDQLSMLAGFGKEFASYLSGLDQDTRNLFVEFKKGGPVLTDLGKAMQKAFIDVGIGEFQINLVQSLDALRNKRDTLDILTDRGLSYADALRVATDETLALAIASGTIDTSELNNIIKLIKELRAKEELDTVLDKINEEIDSFISDLSTKEKIKLNYTPLEQEAILSDQTLTAMVKLGQAGAEAFKIRLQQITSSTEFMQGVFDKGFSNAMESFAIKEQEIEIEFKEANADNFDIVKKAQEEIETINIALDDYEAGLTRLEKDEEAINEKYDARFEALDKIEKANQLIAQEQKSQLTIADALSRGDIAAAAAAAQQARADRAANQAQETREMLELSKERELASLKTIVNGQALTREQIEENIKNLQEQIFNIEEDRLEPAQRLIDLAEIAKQKRIEELDVLGKTRSEWESIKNNIDLARINTDAYIKSLVAALNVEKPLLESYQKQTTIEGSPVNPNTTDKPETSNEAAVELTETEKKIAELNRRIAITRFRVRDDETNLSAAQEKALMELNVDRINEVIRLGGTPDMTGMIAPGTSQKITDLPPGFAMGGLVSGYMSGGKITRYASGGKIGYYPMGGLIPYKAAGGLFTSVNSDTVPAMLTPGEFVIKRSAVENFGSKNLSAINNGTYKGDSVYNYEVNVNVQTDANADQIAREVIGQINRIESQRIRSNRF